ncbi:NADP(H)-dependent aldo-keto reductase [Alphaproteobacteria bacterium]|jgi:aryl-alcohol dehydrogenase-like predicted oxidoreductase|nr:NADP(H)-dependent aldo-keto reductase [Alphaproteobacteria bacterium]
MEYRKLGHTDIKVSAICLGTMTWGKQNTEAEGHEQMDYALDMGINFFDTAELYAIPPERETQGSTERIIGTWFKKTGNRDKVILASKVAGRSQLDYFRDSGAEAELSRSQIMEAIDKSLARLQTDYLDLYQLHWPDRPLQIFGGLGYKHYGDEINRIEDILDVLADIQKAGKVRHFGLSNETPWGIMKFLHYADSKPDLPRIVSVQNAYNLLNRIYELGASEIYHREGVGLLAYSPLAQGFLSGKYQKGARPPGARATLFNRLQRYETPSAESAIDRYLDIAKKYGVDPTQMANQFVTTRDFVTSNIIGATTMEQLKIAVTSIDLDLHKDMLKDIEDAHLVSPNPCP